jgi:protein-S-isoprenylcysteine O-methyltransferase Ste14
MYSRFEDILGKALMVVIFGYLLVQQIASVIVMLNGTAEVDYWLLVVISRVFSLIFLVMVVYFTITRLPPKDSIEGVEPRITAIGGTFFMMLLIVLPTGTVGPELRVLSTVMIVFGTLFSSYCLLWLGRSFSIMATARELVTSGPYKFVRHPLYLAEGLTVLGIIISNWSLVAIAVGIVQFGLQFRRMYNEERVLRRTFAEYEEYAERTPLFIPSIGKSSC